MPQLTFNIELGSRPDKFGRWSVMIRLHLKGQKPARVLTSIKVVDLAKSWKPKKWGKWIKGHPQAKKINDTIEAEYNGIKKQVEKWRAAEPGTILTPAIIAARLKAGTSTRYFDWLDKVMEDVKLQAYSTYIGKRSAVNGLKKWAGEDLLLDSVTPSLVRSYQQHLLKTPIKHTGARRKGSSINKELERLHVLHQAILVKTGQSPKKAAFLSPWVDLDPVPEVKARKAKLNESTIADVASLTVQTTRRNLTPEKAFKIWLLCHFLAGMRFIDVMLLRYKNFTLDENGVPVHLHYEMFKTGNSISIPVFAEASELLKSYWNESAKPTDYILPYLHKDKSYYKVLTYEQYRAASFETKRELYNVLAHWNRQMNKCLKIVQSEAGLDDNLRTHNARHSFAGLAKRIMKQDKTITMQDIQMMLGHSSITTTEIYTKDFDDEQCIQPMQAIFNRKKN